MSVQAVTKTAPEDRGQHPVFFFYSTLSSFQQKYMKHTKKQEEHMTHKLKISR